MLVTCLPGKKSPPGAGQPWLSQSIHMNTRLSQSQYSPSAPKTTTGKTWRRSQRLPRRTGAQARLSLRERGLAIISLKHLTVMSYTWLIPLSPSSRRQGVIPKLPGVSVLMLGINFHRHLFVSSSQRSGTLVTFSKLFLFREGYSFPPAVVTSVVLFLEIRNGSSDPEAF